MHRMISHRLTLSSASSSWRRSPLLRRRPLSSSSDPPTRLGVAGTLFFGSLCVGTFSLGVWQTQRFFEKQRLIAQRELELSLPPLTSVAADPTSSSSFRRWQLTGRYRHEYELLVGPRAPPHQESSGLSSSPQGYFVVTPLELDHGGWLLVNRGWVPRSRAPPPRPTAKDDAAAASYDWDRPEGLVTVTVVPTKPEAPRFLVAQHDFSRQPAILYWFDLATLQEMANPYDNSKDAPCYALATRVVPDDDDDAKNGQDAFPLAPSAQQVGEFPVPPAMHVGYAVTWYGLSLAGAYMLRMLLTRGR